jgi:hypothetical protein
MPGRGFLLPSYIALNVVAFAGATMDIGSDGVYVTTLRPKVQAFFAGMQSMFWSIGPIVALDRTNKLPKLQELLSKGQPERRKQSGEEMLAAMKGIFLAFGGDPAQMKGDNDQHG